MRGRAGERLVDLRADPIVRDHGEGPVLQRRIGFPLPSMRIGVEHEVAGIDLGIIEHADDGGRLKVVPQLLSGIGRVEVGGARGRVPEDANVAHQVLAGGAMVLAAAVPSPSWSVCRPTWSAPP